MSNVTSASAQKKAPLFRIPMPVVLGFLAYCLIVVVVNALAYTGILSLEPRTLQLSMGVLRWLVVLGLLIYSISRRSLTVSIFVAMVAGIEVGIDFPRLSLDLDIITTVFLKLIKTIIAPLLFATLVVGIAGHGNIRQVGRMGWKSLLYFELVTTVALVIGMFAANLFNVGDGLDPSMVQDMNVKLPDTKPQEWKDIVAHIFPENIAKSIGEGATLQIVVFSILFGIGMLMVSERHRRIFLDFSESLAEIMFKFTNMVMYLAPFAVAASLAVAVSKFGFESLKVMGWLVVVLFGSLLVFVGGVLVPIALSIRMPLLKFITTISEPVMLAFATSSSETALPKAMSSMERMGVPRKVVSFVMPMGYSFNLDGTTLYLSLASIFVIHAAGVEMSLGSQIVMMLTLMLTSKGVAGVSRASLVILLGTAATFGLPEWPIMMIFGIDAIMDMMRTSVNVMGNCLATAFVAKWEGEVKKFGEPWVPEAETKDITA
jgi:proton glutamate symport protein